MNKKIIALILLLPMILMMTLYTAVNTVSLQVKVPVSKIEILSEEFVSLNLDKGERFFVDYAVYPTTASNKEVNFSTENIGEQPKAELEYSNGYIVPKSAGMAYACFTTVDGSYRARVQVVVKSTQLVGISCSLSSSTLIVGQTATITTQYNPTSASDKTVEYISSNTNIVSVSDNGVITAKGKGGATITVRSLANGNIYDTIDVVVNSEQLLAIAPTTITTWHKEGSINLTVGTVEEYGITYKFQTTSGADLGESIIKAKNDEPFTSLGDGNYKFDYEFVDETYNGEVVVKFTISTQNRTESKQCIVNKVETLEAEFESEGDLSFVVGSTINWKNYITVSPEDLQVTYAVSYSNANIEKKGSSGYLATANKIGYTKVVITIQPKEDQLNQEVTIEKDVYIIPSDLIIAQSGKEYGIEKVWTIGKTDVNGNEINHELNLLYIESEKGANFSKLEEKIVYQTSEPNKVVVENGKIKILDNGFTGIVEIKAVLAFEEQLMSEPLAIRCVGNGVEVSDFLSLHKATKEGKVIVLQANIDEDFGKNADGSAFYQGANVDKIYSTYDVKYYENKGEGRPQVITLLQFRNDVYGNGYTINADNVAGLDSTGKPKGLFNGPLNLVAMGEMAKVKAQDNICFALYENVTLNNIELKACNLQAKNGMIDLNDLNCVGTVVEVLGDNVNIEYSRISNGRTLVRAFGDVNDADKTINVKIKNSILSQAREFIIRVGSNKIVRSEEGTTFEKYSAPFIDKSTDNNFAFPVQSKYNKTESKYQNYESKYIKTYLTIENSVLKDSGLFCIGIDSHFSGKVLYDASSYIRFDTDLANWKGTDGTSYGAKVILEGDVRMYDWKNLDNVDSSSLIEINENAPDTIKNLLNFNIKEMINHLGNTPMIYKDQNNNQYVHGGIVFFGGGLNYGLLEDNSQSFKGLNIDALNELKLSGYVISLADVGQEKMELAAGDKPFYFAMYEGTSKFNPVVQDIILAGDSAYNCIYFE